MFSGLSTRPFARLCLIAATLLVIQNVRAIEVQQSDGAKIEARRVTFDGTKFTLFTAAGKVAVPTQQVQYLDADESRTNQAQDTITKKEEEIAQLKTEIARLSALVDDERKKTEEARKETETYRKRLMQPQETPTPDPALQTEINRLQTENASLKAENTQTLEKATRLEQQLAQTQKEKAKPAPEFVLQSFAVSAGKAPRLSLAQGTLTNPSSESFGLVVLEVTAYDAAGKVLDSVNTFLTQVKPNATRPVRASLEVAPEKIEQIKAVVVDVFKEAPEPDSGKKTEASEAKEKINENAQEPGSGG